MLQKKIVERVYPLFRLARGNGLLGMTDTTVKKILVLKPHQLCFKNTYHFAAVSIKDMKITYDPSKKT